MSNEVEGGTSMAQIFGPGADLAAKAVIAALCLCAVGAASLAWGLPHVDYLTGVKETVDQVVPFSHQHHVAGLGLDCRYCHTAVEMAANAGMPTTETCMTCHSEIWTGAEMLAPVRDSLANHQPLVWTRVVTLPDYVYFDHSIHIAKGIGCASCHGDVARMPLTWKERPLTMGDCLACHRDPAPNLRPPQAIFDTEWKRDASSPSAEALMRAYHIHTTGLTDCSTCHR
jgi:hypothetical protein